jgi:hypothetical protein
MYKAFNPLLGETFEMVRPEAGFRSIGEQVGALARRRLTPRSRTTPRSPRCTPSRCGDGSCAKITCATPSSAAHSRCPMLMFYMSLLLVATRCCGRTVHDAPWVYSVGHHAPLTRRSSRPGSASWRFPSTATASRGSSRPPPSTTSFSAKSGSTRFAQQIHASRFTPRDSRLARRHMCCPVSAHHHGPNSPGNPARR